MLVSPNAMHLLLKHHVVAQHPAVYFCVVMTVLEDSFRLGRQRGYYLVQSPDFLTLHCSWSRQQVAAVTAPARIHCFSSNSGLGLASRVHATGSSVKAWAQKVWSSPAMEKGEGTSGCCGRSVSPAQNRWWNVPLVSLGSAGHSIKHIVPLDHLAQMTTERCRNSKGGTLTANRWVHQDLKRGIDSSGQQSFVALIFGPSSEQDLFKVADSFRFLLICGAFWLHDSWPY